MILNAFVLCRHPKNHLQFIGRQQVHICITSTLYFVANSHQLQRTTHREQNENKINSTTINPQQKKGHKKKHLYKVFHPVFFLFSICLLFIPQRCVFFFLYFFLIIQNYMGRMYIPISVRYRQTICIKRREKTEKKHQQPATVSEYIIFKFTYIWIQRQ